MAGCSDENSTPDPQVIAHRGVSISYPENSLQAFDAARTLGIDAIELDVYLTRDDSVVIFHDAEVNRLTGLPGVVGSYTAAQLRAGVFATSGGFMPTFAEFVNRYPSAWKTVLVDVKEGQGIDTMILVARQLERLVRQAGLEGVIVATSTQPAPLDTLRAVNPNFQVAIEIGDWGQYVGQIRSYSRVLASHLKLSPSAYQTVHTSGATLITFTPNTVAEFQTAIANGCDAIITDNPVELKKYLATRH